MSIRKLPGLNGLRGIAASLVLIGHAYQIAGLWGVDWAMAVFLKRNVGSDMVNLFFVISGFIITYVLIREKAGTGTISLRHFYIRRILRIWPLYFLLVVAVFLLSSYSTVYSRFPALNGSSAVVFTLFVVNFNYFIHAPLSVLPHYWSLSVEEQFYLFWPALLRRFSPVRVAAGVLVLLVTARNFAALMATRHPGSLFWPGMASSLLESRFSSMAIGALGALMIREIRQRASLLFLWPAQGLAWLLFIGSIVFRFYVPYIHGEVMAFLYLYLILSVTVSSRPLFTLENGFFDLTGRISYGLYMYHWVLLPLLILLFRKLGVFTSFTRLRLIPFVAVSYGATYLVAYLSFRYFESRFSRLKLAVG